MKTYDPNNMEVVFGDKKCTGISEEDATFVDSSFAPDVLVIDLKVPQDISKVVVNGITYTKAQEDT